MTRRARCWLLSPLLIAACGGGAPTWTGEVGALVHQHCAGCHRPGQSAPFPLQSFDDAFRKRRQIGRVVARGLMPPWLPTHGDFVDDRRLDAATRETLLAWVDAGAPRGDGEQPAPPPPGPAWQLGQPDLILTAPEPVVVPADGPDRFRNLVIPVEVDAVRYVTAVAIRPDNPSVHHAILQVDETRDCRRRAALDPEPGFPGMAMGLSRAPDGHFLGWTPGKRTRHEPPERAWQLRPGSDLVLQLHLTPTGREETVRPRIGLWFGPSAPTERPYSLVLYSEAIDIPPGATDYVVTDHLTLPVATTLLGIYPHAHYLCARMTATATLPDGTERVLLAIDAWDFDWQDDYRYRQPVHLPAGTRVAFDYRYDNSRANPANPHDPPQRVRHGLESTDEMATLTLTLLLDDESNRPALDLSRSRRDLQKRPHEAAPWLNLAAASRELGALEDAIAAAERGLQTAEASDPSKIAAALRELGISLLAAGRTEPAEQALAAAVRRDPGESVARMHLGGIYARSGRTAAALAQFEAAVEVHEHHPILQNNLATALFASDQLERAAHHYRRALALDPDYFNARFNLGRVLAALGEPAAARVELERARALRPDDPAVAEALRGLGR